MTKDHKVKALLDAYIELAQADGYDDAQILDALTDIFDRSKLEALGFGNFIKSYFEEEQPRRPAG